MKINGKYEGRKKWLNSLRMKGAKQILNNTIMTITIKYAKTDFEKVLLIHFLYWVLNC